MPTDSAPAIQVRELIAEPCSKDPRARRQFFGFLQKWRSWLCNQVSRAQMASGDLSDRGTDDLLALALLVQFIRDRAPEAIPSLDRLSRRQTPMTLGQVCVDVQSATTCPVLKAVFEPTPYTHECILPTPVMERAFWNPIVQASRRLYGPHLPITVFGDLHQWCLAVSPSEAPSTRRGPRSETQRYDKGIHYTPPALVNYLTSRALGQAFTGLSPEQVLQRRILDPSCGCGVFLVAALRYLFAWLDKGKPEAISLQDRLDILVRMIHGTDLDVRAVDWTRRGLLLAAWDGHRKPDQGSITVPELSRNIIARDFLTPAPIGTGEGIDVILGGPPFVRLQQMLHSDPDSVERYKRAFRTARSGQFDLYILFIEKAIELLAPNGFVAFSVSNTFLRSETGRGLRRLIGEECQVHEIIEFEDPKIYPDAVIQIGLIFLQKSAERGPGQHVWVRGKGLLREKLSALATHSTHEAIEIRPLPAHIIRSDRWAFQSTDETDLLARIQAAGTPLNRLPIHIDQGIVTGADEVFLVRKLDENRGGTILVEQRKVGRRFWMEAPILRPIIRNRDIHGYVVPSPSTLCLVPYSRDGSLLDEAMLRRDFPRAYEYLLDNKDRLTSGIRKRLDTWYDFTSPTALRHTNNTKVIGGLITSGGDMTIVSGGDLCHGGVLTMAPDPLRIDPYYLLAVCNSSIFWAFVQHKMPTMGIGRHTIRLDRLRQFPLVVPRQDNQASVQAIVSAARSLDTTSVPLPNRKETIAEIDRMVRHLYALPEDRLGAA